MSKKKSKHHSSDEEDNDRKKKSTKTAGDHHGEASSSSHKSHEKVNVPDLPEPWQAFHSSKRNRTFYYNPVTKETKWEKPVDASVVKSSHRSSERKEKDQKPQQATTDIPASQSRKRHPEEETNTQQIIQPPSSSESQTDGDTSMDVDPILPPSEKRARDFVFRLPSESSTVSDEPMDIDVAEEVNELRTRHQFVPVINDNELAESQSWVEFQELPPSFIIFDTSALLGDFNVLRLAMSVGSIACIIPYVAIQELDALKTSSREKLSRMAINMNNYILYELKRDSRMLFVEPAWESAQPLDFFDCRKNDDYILKCAIVFAQRLQETTANVFLATNDKNLSIKALANGISAYTDPEIIDWIKSSALSKTALPEKKQIVEQMQEDAAPSSSFISSPRIPPPSQASFRNGFQGTFSKVQKAAEDESRVLNAISWRDQTGTAQRIAGCLEETLRSIDEKRLIGTSRSQEAESLRLCKLARDANRLEKSLERLVFSQTPSMDDVGVFIDVLSTLHRYYCDSHLVRNTEIGLDKKTAHELLCDTNSSLRSNLCELFDKARSVSSQLGAAA